MNFAQEVTLKQGVKTSHLETQVINNAWCNQKEALLYLFPFLLYTIWNRYISSSLKNESIWDFLLVKRKRAHISFLFYITKKANFPKPSDTWIVGVHRLDNIEFISLPWNILTVIEPAIPFDQFTCPLIEIISTNKGILWV